jgi:hypothetical protein
VQTLGTLPSRQLFTLQTTKIAVMMSEILTLDAIYEEKITRSVRIIALVKWLNSSLENGMQEK